MAKFRYKMQSILDIKLKMETQAKQEFAAAQSALLQEEQKLEQLKQRKSAYEKESRALLTGRLKVSEIRENKAAILRMEDYIKEQNTRIQIASAAVERARLKLQESMKERKTQESLKEKEFEEFMREENRRESKEIDELTSYTYGQKASEA